ncbi:MAG: response regulator, partial [Synechococcus sp.]
STFDPQDHAYQFFAAEAPELLQTLESGLLELSSDSSTAQVHEMMRAAHSIKGGSASVGLETIKTLAHRLEDYLKALYSEAATVDFELQTLLLQAFDCLKYSLQSQLDTGAFDEEQALATADPIFTAIEALLGDALAASANFIPSSEDLGIDIAASIFEVDVEEGLTRLKTVLASPSEYEVVGELRAQAEVFSGFAELINLKGFGEICTVTIAAIERAPERILDIVALAIDDFEAGRDAVLGGDRSMGGSPSPALLALANGEAPAESSEAVTSPTVESTAQDSEIQDIFGAIADEDTAAEDSMANISPAVVTALEAGVPSEAVENVFGDLAAQAETGMEQEGLEDIFGAIAADNTAAEDPVANTSPDAITAVEAGVPSEAVENVFGDLAAQAETSTDQEELEDIFGAIAADNTAAEDPVANTSPDAITTVEAGVPSEAVESVFGDLAAQAETSTDQEELEDIFGAIAAEGTPIESDLPTTEISTDALASATPEAESEITESEIAEPVTAKSETAKPVTAEPAKAEPIAESTQGQTDTPQLPIETALQKLQQNIANLQPDPEVANRDRVNLQSSKTESQKPRSTAAASPAKSAPKVARSTVRVETDRLDRMGNQVGELSIMQNSLALQNSQLQAAIRELQRRSHLFQTYVKQVRAIADELAVDPEGYSKRNSDPSAAGESHWGDAAEFDSLEMDRYSTLYSSLQTLLEESAQLEEASDDVVLYSRQSNQTLGRQQQQLEQLRDELTWARMLPLNNVLQRFPRTVHEMCGKYGKRVNLTLDGTGVLVDKSVLEKIYDPLLHLMRNAFDHGIEPPEARRQAGKPEQGTIAIRAYHQGSETVIEISDDGKGIDPERIRQKAMALGLASAEQLRQIPEARLVDFLFESGFSTAEKVSDLSGRGVGLDVVRVQLRELKGAVNISSTPGKGTTFTLRLPLTLTMTKLVVCMAGSSAVAVPSDNIAEIEVPTPSDIKVSGQQRYLAWRDRLVLIRPLSSLINYACPISTPPESQALKPIQTPQDWAFPILVIKIGTEYTGIEIDRLVTEQELAVKPFGAAMSPPAYLYGCTVMADGTLVPVVDAISILDRTKGSTGTYQTSLPVSDSEGDRQSAFQQRQVATILIVDDSVAQRRSLSQSCQRAGYRVLQASNGQEALAQLEQADRVDGIICDIEMPKMNGFEFLTVRRQTLRFAQIPVTMLTSRSSQKHRQLALKLGAGAYLTKPYLEQELLSTLRSMCESSSPSTVAT